MPGTGEAQKEAIRPDFNRSILIDFPGAKINWHFGELFPRYYFIVTNSRLAATKVVKVYNGRADAELGFGKSAA